MGSRSASAQPARSSNSCKARGARETLRERAPRREGREPRLWAVAGRQLQPDVEARRRQRSRRPLGPFDKDDRRLGDLLAAELAQLAGAGEAVEIGMDDGADRGVVGLDEREGRARHLEVRIAGERPDHRPRQRRLAGPEPARQRDEIAGLQIVGEEARRGARWRRGREGQASIRRPPRRAAATVEPRPDHA